MESGDERPAFYCGDNDLEEFYFRDSIEGCNQLLCVTYIIMDAGKVAAFFSVSNDSISRKKDGRSAYGRASGLIPHEKRYSSLPAAKIGRLGIAQEYQRKGVGTVVLDFLKGWFTNENKTGCRFLVVDAYNKEHVIHFYQKNGFAFLTGSDEKSQTRIMYFDLIKFRE